MMVDGNYFETVEEIMARKNNFPTTETFNLWIGSMLPKMFCLISGNNTCFNFTGAIRTDTYLLELPILPMNNFNAC